MNMGYDHLPQSELEYRAYAASQECDQLREQLAACHEQFERIQSQMRILMLDLELFKQNEVQNIGRISGMNRLQQLSQDNLSNWMDKHEKLMHDHHPHYSNVNGQEAPIDTDNYMKPALELIGFLTSTIKSGEPWTATCEEMLNNTIKRYKPVTQ